MASYTKISYVPLEPLIHHEINLDDRMFSDLGVPWELFKQGNYKDAFGPIYTKACLKNPKAEYLI